MTASTKDQFWAAGGFAASALLTGLFVEAFDGYLSTPQMLLSAAIAGGKWAIQLLLASVRLPHKRWRYFREMATVCAVGSCLLLPYILTGGDWRFFLGSLVGCVAVMSVLIVWRIKAIGLSHGWTLLWFFLLAIAVTLQLTVVFRVFG